LKEREVVDNKYRVAVLIILVLVVVGFHRFSLASVTDVPFGSLFESPFASPLPTPSLPPLTNEAQIALRHVSETYDIPLDRLQVGDETIIEYPLTRRTLWEAKVADRKHPRAYLVEIDVDSGQIVDGEKVRQLEGEAYLSKYGKLEPELYDRLQTMRNDDVIKVSIWVSSVSVTEMWEQVAQQYPEAVLEGPRPTKSSDLDLHRQITAEMKAARRQIYQDCEAPVVALLEGQGFKVTYSSQFAPVIFAELPKSAILELVDRDDIERVYLTSSGGLLLDSVVPTIRANRVWGSGIIGSGVQVAVVEEDGIDFTHWDLRDGVYFDPGDPNEFYHATMVAGVIASRNAQWRGVAYGVPALYSANAGSDDADDLIAATEGALSYGAQVLNHSYYTSKTGYLDDMARYLDHVAFSDCHTVVVAAGNYTSEYVNSPALAYNVIAVGGINDQDTARWSDDVMWTAGSGEGSAYKNPRDGRDKPEVVAVAASVTSTSVNNDFWTLQGTSYAAPQVSGLAALIVDRDPFLGEYWPEVIKAIIMASAVHNIEGSSRLSDKDGVGAIDAALAYEVVDNAWWRAESLDPEPFQLEYPLELNAGAAVRVVIVWPSHPDDDHPPVSDDLKSDLDLYIDDPVGNQIASSVSIRNNFEIVEFTAPKSGIYQIVVQKWRFDADWEYLGVAWAQRSRVHLPMVLRDW
jgi:subtilisin family serine protease